VEGALILRRENPILKRQKRPTVEAKETYYKP